MKLKISEKLKDFALSCPFDLYIVGGYVRNALARLTGESDLDICAPVTADEFLAAANRRNVPVKQVYKNTGTVKILLEGECEFASFRSDEYVRGIHNPVKSHFTSDIKKDALRRDFTCNAVYYDIKNEKIVDPLGGVNDIKNKIIKTVAPANKVFGEDGLRLMRLARISAETGFTPTDETLAGARQNCKLISDVSAERVYAELMRILYADERNSIRGAQYKGLKILDETRVLDEILPELTIGRGMEQNKKYHLYDVLEHSLKSVLYADGKVRLAALLHDIGKPFCYLRDGNFYLHAQEGEGIVKEVLKRLKAPKKVSAECARLCETHMYDYALNAREGKVARFIVSNIDILDKILLLKQADYSACADRENVAPCVEKWERIYKKMKDNKVPFTVRELNVTADELYISGVPKNFLGAAYKYLLSECAAGGIKNEKACLLACALNNLKIISKTVGTNS